MSLASAVNGAARRLSSSWSAACAGRRLLLIGERAAVGGDAEEHVGDAERLGLLGVVAALPVGIVADRVDDEAAHHPVAARHLGGLGRHRHQRVHEAGMRDTPDPGVHAAHGVAEHEPHVAQTQTLRRQPVLRLHHVIVVVAGKFRPHAVGGLGGFAVADPVRQHDEILGGVERFAWAEQLAGEARGQHAGAGAGGAVQDQNRLARRLADGAVVHAQLRHHLAGVEAEIARGPGALLRRGELRRRRQGGDQQQGRARHGRRQRSQGSHRNLLGAAI